MQTQTLQNGMPIPVVYRICRWFSLDTVLGVIAIQLNLMQPISWAQLANMGGLCVATSLCYMCDRFIDAILDKGPLSHRHHLYANNQMAVIATFMVLGSITLVFWLHLAPQIQWKLGGLGLGFLLHVWCLPWPQYQRLKSITTAIIFTLVMVSISEVPISHPWARLIFLYTMFNLHIHSCMEHRHMAPAAGTHIKTSIGIGLLAIGAAYQIEPWMSIAFGIGVLCHWRLLATHGDFWFEWGELCFAWPFFWAALA